MKKSPHAKRRKSGDGERRNRENQNRNQGKGRSRDRSPRGGAVLKVKATVDKNRKGFAFLIFENKSREDAFVSPQEARSLFHGDRVEVLISASGRLQGVRVLEHRFREVVGKFTPDPESRRFGPVSRKGTGQAGWVVYERKNSREEIFVPQVGEKINPGDWVRAELNFDSENEYYPVTGKIVEVYGSTLPPAADLPMIANEFGLQEGHSEEAEKEAIGFRLDFLPTQTGQDVQKVAVKKNTKGRVDLRELPLITIDGETARDFDDAVYVEQTREGYVLWVAIADVSHYVKEGTALDQDARAKATSVYFPERAFHMLPRALSENLCSLRPNEPRLALVSKIFMDTEGKRIRTEVMEALIQSRRRATYTEIQNELEQNRGNSKWEYTPHFKLFELLKKQRKVRGSLDFELPEAELRVEPTGEVISITNRPRLDAHRLIEEFMIAANEAVTDWMMQRDFPFVYRVHEVPTALALEKFRRLATNVGVKVKFAVGGDNAQVIADLVRRLEGHPAQTVLNMALLRSMKQAIYRETHGIHFGLASPGYTHFTSPIRRYPDLVVHRLIRMALERGSPKKADNRDFKQKIEKDLAKICEHCSYRERLAADAERESIKVKQVRAVMKHLGDEFEGKVVGMVASGLFVQINDPYSEGLVSVDSMPDDFYEFDEDRMIFRGRRKRRTFQLGDKIQVRAAKADLDRRQIDFVMV